MTRKRNVNFPIRRFYLKIHIFLLKFEIFIER